MEKDIAEKAKQILCRIRDVEDKIKKIDEMYGWAFRLCTVHHQNALVIPDKIQETVYTLVKTSYENELNKLENELREL